MGAKVDRLLCLKIKSAELGYLPECAADAAVQLVLTQVLPQRLQHALLALAIETVVGIVDQNHLSLVQKAMGSGQQIQISLENACRKTAWFPTDRRC